MPYTPTKRCDRADRHDWPHGHEWYENNVLRRWCPGRNTTRRTQTSRKAEKEKPNKRS